MERPEKPIQYNDGYLTIHIKETDPACLHHQLLKAMVLVMKNQITHSVKEDADIDAMLALTKLMDTLVPTESDLLKALENG